MTFRTAYRDLPNNEPEAPLTPLELARDNLEMPDLTEAELKRALLNPESLVQNDTARLRYWEGLTVQEIARLEGCTRGPVIGRLRVWRERAKLMLEGR